MAKAKNIEKASAPKIGIKELHKAFNDISRKMSQADILKTLVQHAGQFTPRGAFFIIKNEHFVGWRTFGSEKGDSEEAIREVFLPVSADSILSESARSLTTVESSAGTYSDDTDILNKLNFEGSPDKMYAIPLVVRGRAVAVLYADYGNQGAEVSLEGLETMVRVAGLTVEVLASAKGSSTTPRESRKKSSKSFVSENFAPVEQEPKESAQPQFAATPIYNTPVDTSYKSSFESEGFTQQPSFKEESPKSYFDEYQPTEDTREEIPTYEQEEAPAVSEEKYPAYEEPAWSEAPAEAVTEINADDYSQSEAAPSQYSQDFQTETKASEYSQNFQTETNVNDYSQGFSYQPPVESNAPAESDFSASPVNEYQFNQNQTSEAPKTETFEAFNPPPTETFAPVSQQGFAPAAEENFGKLNESAGASFAEPVETPQQQQPVQQTPPVRSRFSERNVDLPIEVSEDERRLHNDARRFARLLVSEIKLYNEQKVKEGREAGDLYERLREAIDRSREMYDKRIQPPVAAKFDYFHYELVNTLAEGDDSRLGTSYPGASV